MNVNECDILKAMMDYQVRNQRDIAELTGSSLGSVNAGFKNLIADGYLTKGGVATEKAITLYENSKPKSAVILAAGFGMRMVPINMETTKGLLEVNGEPLIERQIRQLHEVGVKDIAVVVGYMKEQYDYLIDEYGVKLIVNADYASCNNIRSLYLARYMLNQTYIVPCDIYSRNNPFSEHELYSWYLMSDQPSAKSGYRVNRKKEIIRTTAHGEGNRMIGIAYVNESDSE